MPEILAAPSLTEPLTDMLRSIMLVLPKALAFAAILATGWLVAMFIRVAVGRLLIRVGFDRAVERGGIRRAVAASGYDPSVMVARLISYAVLLVTLQLSFGVFGPNPVSDLIR